ncbi:polyprenyl synthetase family protein [Psychroserpens sp. SPM9]|uniref:polyprenyl synthetase family protein n=1 Tax=Psychroserpens sp. SPM9 TaxID=2975598 RepID=UPI0021A54370|nr:polyprenyl synthetase family protein [Psychroserpens sp. SPM9]MDG5490531.1 polyprenyl synthetase family protein [Psychroserpens sp. SPM9]
MSLPKSHPYHKAIEIVKDDFLAVENYMTNLIQSQEKYLNEEEQLFYKKGKKLRPLLFLLAAKIASRNPNEILAEKVHAGAASIEMVHVGSLIHDDIVDKAPIRRGLPTISASRGYEIALIIGDLQWIKATRLMSSFMETKEDILLMKRFLETGEEVCKGQLDEMLREPEEDINTLINRYYRTIDRKTGQLISFACEGGARIVNGQPSVVGALQRYGTLMGRAFQVMDDVFDIVRPNSTSGKEQLIDLKQGRLSLPIIYALRALPKDHFLQNILKNLPLTEEQLHEGISIIKNGNGWIEAASEARGIASKAISQLMLLPESPYRNILIELADFTVNQGIFDEHEIETNTN